MSEERRQAVAQQKARSRCAVCSRLGHWAGDPQCPKRTSAGSSKHNEGGKKGSSRGKSRDKAYFVATAKSDPRFFSIRDDDGSTSQDEMEQDSGMTPVDERRKHEPCKRQLKSGRLCRHRRSLAAAATTT